MDGNVTVVTGSASGVGEAVARALVARGGRVVVNSVRSVEAGQRIADELGEQAIYCQADVSDPNAAVHLIETAVDAFGRLDALVNNAGTTARIPLDDLDAVTPEIWDTILQTNLLGPWRLVQAAAPALKADGGGAIVNVSSIAGTNPSGSSIPYCVSKAGLNHLTRLLAKALGPEVRVNAVAPGFVETPWTADWPGRRERAIGMSPLARVATPDDVAQVCLMLMDARHVTGEIVHVDGGQRFG